MPHASDAGILSINILRREGIKFNRVCFLVGGKNLERRRALNFVGPGRRVILDGNMNEPSEITPSLEAIEAELKQRVAGYPRTRWGRKQSDDWDRRTSFIYRTRTWAEMQQRAARLDKPLADYAINRWFNFWSARAVERIFHTLPGVEANVDEYDRLVDFSIQGITFDHKTSVFPRQYPESARFAWQYKPHLISWLYAQQSRQQRYHTANRLFIMLYARDGQHWALRAEVGRLQTVIRRYVLEFSAAKLTPLWVDGHTARADVIWCFK